MEEKLAFLRDQNRSIQQRVQLLDELTIAIKTNNPNVKQANQIWSILKDDHYFWYISDQVLKFSKVDETKVFILVILQNAIKHKWGALPQDQRQNIKSYIVNVVLQYGAIENIPKSLHNILSKANAILVQIVKYQWNSTWKSFINDICSASIKDMNICENNFSILKMLSEQIFDYSKNQMTQKQIHQLKNQMNEDFTTIYKLCDLILNNMNQAKPSLLKVCLQTLNAFLSWIPTYYIVYTDLIDKLILLISSDYLRNYALQCLVQIAGLPVQLDNQDFKNKQLSMLKATTVQINSIIPLRQRQQIPAMLSSVKRNARHAFEILARQISMFYSQFFKIQYNWLEIETRGSDQLIEVCRVGLKYIIMFMQINQDHVFKIAIQFYHFLIGNYLQTKKNPEQGSLSFMNKISLGSVYPTIFNQVMQIISLKMAKPDEVLIVIDETGYPVRQQLENTQNSSLYEIMKQLAGFLSEYDWVAMKKFIINEIQKQNGPAFSFDILNSLSWVVGSLHGCIKQKQQRQFFINTLRTLLHLCELKKGKQNKAVIASCIMYVVGQYPSFLNNNWSFLKTVIKKLFEFMKQDFTGIMEMACNAFLKITKYTAQKFVTLQQNESQPYIHEIIHKIPEQTKKLTSDSLKLIFYQAVGYLISAETNSGIQLELMKETLGTYLFEFQNIMNTVQNGNPQILKQQQIEQKILYFLKINENLAIGVGQQYVMMLEMISEVINKIYLFYSNEVNITVKNNGKHMLNFLTVKIMRAIKKQVIRIYMSYLQKCNNLNFQQAQYILSTFIFPLGQLLKDFQECEPETKQQQFVSLFTLVLEKLFQVLQPQFLSKLLEMIFASSLPLITTDFNSFPEIRVNFFAFLKALIKYNFNLLYSLDENHFKTILDCVIWSFRHELSNYSDLGLQLIEDILNNVNSNPAVINVFYPKYHIRLLTDILDVMTDGFHKSGLDAQSKIFYLLLHITTQNFLTAPIGYDQSPETANSMYLYNFLVDRLSQAFPNLTLQATRQRIAIWFKQTDEKLFKLQIGDYLVLINRYTAQDIRENVAEAPVK